MPSTDYNSVKDDLTAIKMVYNRMRFLEQNATNEQIIKEYVLEIMHELEPCFQIGDANVGNESSYSIPQLSIIADIVSVYVLMYTVGANSQGSSGSAPSTRFLKRTKAGSAEVEWGLISVKEGNTLFVDAPNLISMYKKDAARKARNLGCILDICDDCTTSVEGWMGAMPMLNIQSCGCSS